MRLVELKPSAEQTFSFSVKDRWLIDLWGRGFQIMNEDARSEAENWWKINFAENDLAP